MRLERLAFTVWILLHFLGDPLSGLRWVMRNDVQKPQGGGVPRNHRNGSSNEVLSVRSLSNCMRIVSSAASNVASTVRKAGVSIVSSIANGHDDAGHDQVVHSDSPYPL